MSEPISRTEIGRDAGSNVPGHQRTEDNLYAPQEHDLNRAITAIDQHYDVEDLGYAGDARVINLRDKLTGSYIMTVTMTNTP